MPYDLHERVTAIMTRRAWAEALVALRAHETETWDDAELAWDRG